MDINQITSIAHLPFGTEAIVAEGMKGLKASQLQDGVSHLMSGHDGGLPYRFFEKATKNELKSEIAGYDVFDVDEVCEWTIDKRNKPCELLRELPEQLIKFSRERRDPKTDAVIEPRKPIGGLYFDAYQRWKQNKETPGLPLSRWGYLDVGEVATLNAEGIFTVEQLAVVGDHKMAIFPNQYREYQKKAQQFENAKDGHKAASEAATKMLEMQKQIDALTAQLNSGEIENKLVKKKKDS